MTQSQKIQLRMSELRQKINDADPDKLTDEQRAELDGWTAEYQRQETELRRALVLEDEALEKADKPEEEQDSEEKEMRSIAAGARVHRYVAAAMARKPIDGREAEFNKLLKMPEDGNVQMPLLALLPQVEHRSEDGRRVETRADAVTSLNALDGEVLGGRVLNRVFRRSILDFLGVSRDTAQTGSLIHTVMTGGTTAATVAPDSGQDAAAASFSTAILEPHRLTARYIMRQEDMTRLPFLEQRLQEDLSMVMMQEQEEEVLKGNANLSIGANGLLNGLDAEQKITIADIDANAVDHAAMFAEFVKAIDGLYAEQMGDITAILNVTSYKALLTLTDANLQQTLAQRLRTEGMRFRSTLHVGENAAAGGAWAFASLMNGLEGAATVCTWPSISLINDPYTNAKEGQVILTAVAMHDAAINRKANFRRFETTAGQTKV